MTNWDRTIESFRNNKAYFLLFNNHDYCSSIAILDDSYIYNCVVVSPAIVIKMWRIGMFSHYNEQLSDADVMSHYRK